MFHFFGGFPHSRWGKRSGCFDVGAYKKYVSEGGILELGWSASV